MPPSLWLCMCLILLATCSARPSWHKGVMVVKDLPAPLSFAHPEYSDAQVAAAQAIRDAGEDAQLHMAMMKKKYMDIVRQHYYNAFAPLPFVKERLDDFEPNHPEDVLPVKIIPPQPMFIHHAAGNPCPGNILNCLQGNTASRLGKIVPSSSAGLQPCFGPNCNHIFFKPTAIAKPSHVSHSINRNPPKRPHKPHRICDRKRPDQNCHHHSTFWPTYATVKFNTKLFPPTTTHSSEVINHHNSVLPHPTSSESHVTEESQTHTVLPGKVFSKPKNPSSVPLNNDEKLNIETLRSNTSKLENEILGIPGVILTKSEVQSNIISATSTHLISEAESKSTQSVKPITSTFETTELIPEFKEDAEAIPPLKTQLIHTTPTISFHANDVIEPLTNERTKSTRIPFHEKEKTTTSIVYQTTTESIMGENYESLNKGDQGGKYESKLEITNKVILDPTTPSKNKELKDIFAETTTVVEEDNYDRPMITSSLGKQNGETKTDDLTTLPGDVKQESTTVGEPLEWKSGIGFEAETTSVEGLDEISLEPIFEDNLGQKVFTEHTTAKTIQDPTQNPQEHITNLGREDTNTYTVGSEIPGTIGPDSRNVDEEPIQTTDVSNPPNHKAFEISTLDSVSDLLGVTIDKFVNVTETLDTNVNEDTEDNQEAREDTFTDSYKTISYSTEDLDIFPQTHSVLEEIKFVSAQDQDNRGVDAITTEYSMGQVSDFTFGQRDHLFFSTESSAVLNLNDNLDNQEAREETFTDSIQTDSYSTIKVDNFNVITENELEVIKALSTQSSDSDATKVSTDSTLNISPTEATETNISTQNIDLQKPSTLARENIHETATNQEPSKVKDTYFTMSDEFTTPNDVSLEAKTESSYFQETTESIESKINFDEGNNLFVSTFKNIDYWTTEIAQTTDIPAATGKNSHDNGYPLYSKEDQYLHQTRTEGDESSLTEASTQRDYETQAKTNTSLTKSIEVDAGTTSVPNGFEDSVLNHITTENNLNEPLQSREGGEEETGVHVTPETSQNKEETTTTKQGYATTDIQEGNPTPVTISENKIDKRLEDTTVIEDNTVATTHSDSFADSSKLSPLTGNNDIYNSASGIDDILKITEEDTNEGSTLSYPFAAGKEDITTENNLNELLQSREGEEEETEALEEVTSGTSPGEVQTVRQDQTSTDNQEGYLTLVTTENQNEKNLQNMIVTEATELPMPELRENVFESTTVKYFMETISIESEPSKVTTESRRAENEEKSTESSQTIPAELFGKTDSPGLIFSEDWTEGHTEDTSPNIKTVVPTESLQSKEGEERYISETVSQFPATEVTDKDNTKGTESVYSKQDDPTKNMEATTVSNIQSFIPEMYGKTEGIIDDSTSLTQLKEDRSLLSYQSGVLKFTTEIKTPTEDSLITERIDGTTSPELLLELSDDSNRKARSVQQPKAGITSYPTTECVLCLLGLPHGHRMKRSPESNSPTAVKDNETHNKTKTLQSEKANCSFPDINLDDPENSSFYASTILELLPVIREGYKNNAFSEDDKKVIRSIFGDMKALMDEDTYERMTESTGDLLLGDGASKMDDIIEETDYDSSEYEMSEKERLKRSKKHLQVMNDLLKKVPDTLKSHHSILPQLKRSRVVRSTHVSQAEASAILALLAEKGEAVQLDIADDEDDDEYEYYEDEGEDYGDEDSYVDAYEDDYDKPSFGELIKLARKHRERKARAGKS